MTETNPKGKGPTWNPRRVEGLSDAAFAIIMTLMVLDLRVPEILPPLVTADLSSRLLELWPSFFSYALSFLVLGILWSFHHGLFHRVDRVNTGLIWLNIFFLMVIALMPFATALLGAYGTQQVSIGFYGGHLAMALTLVFLLWWYAAREGLMEEDPDTTVVGSAKRKTLTLAFVALVGASVSFLSTAVSIGLFFLLFVLYVGWDYLGRLRIPGRRA